MNRNSPVALWAALSVGVTRLSGIFVLAQRSVTPPEARMVPRPTLVLPPTVSVTAAPTPASPAPASSPTSSPAGTAEPVPSDWKTYRNTTYGFQFNYPAAWTDADRNISIVDFFTAPPEIDVLDIALVNATGSLAEIAAKDVRNNNCTDEEGVSVDRVPKSGERGVLYVLDCSLMSEGYNYLFTNPSGNVISTHLQQ